MCSLENPFYRVTKQYFDIFLEIKVDSIDKLCILLYRSKYLKWCVCFSAQHEIHCSYFVHNVTPYIRTFDFTGERERTFNYYFIDIQCSFRQNPVLN